MGSFDVKVAIAAQCIVAHKHGKHGLICSAVLATSSAHLLGGTISLLSGLQNQVEAFLVLT